MQCTRKIFNRKRTEQNTLRRLLNEKLHNIFLSSPDDVSVMKEDKVDRTCSTHGRDEKWIKKF